MFVFKTQLEIGEQGEKKLDGFFSQFYTITPVPMELQRLGIDRIFLSPIGSRFTVEYKTDLKAASTGNLFLETEVSNKAGWLWSSVSQLIVYYVPPIAYIYDTIALRKAVQHKELKGKESMPVINTGFFAKGLLVPIKAVVEPILVSQEVIGELVEE